MPNEHGMGLALVKSLKTKHLQLRVPESGEAKGLVCIIIGIISKGSALSSEYSHVWL